ncbi:urease accessory protein UreD [Verrucomicrobiaceae bacterium 227]
MLGSLQSQASLEFSADSEGRTVLSKRRAGGLFHVAKPYWDGRALGVQLVNPTAGLFAGDEMKLQVQVGDGAQVELTSPSSSRFYAMHDRPAKIRQHFTIGKEASLEYHPNWVVPQQGSSVAQETRIDVDESGELIFFDCLSPGRVRHGEQYRYQRYASSLDLRYGGELRAKERMVLEPDQGGWPLVVPGWEVCFYGAVWFVGAGVEECFDQLALLEKKLSGEGLICGVTMQGRGVAVLRLLAARSLLVKKAFTEVRKVTSPYFSILQREQRIPQ